MPANDLSTSPDILGFKRYGTAIAEPPLLNIGLGRLSFGWQAGAVRGLRYGNVELVRGVACVLRDPQWGNHTPVVDDQRIAITDQHASLAQGFHLPVENGRAGPGNEPCLRGQMSVEASESRLTVALTLEALSDFTTARSGLSLLLPLHGVVDSPVEVTHVNGGRETVHLPRLISPSQPLFDIQQLRLSPTPELKVHLDFEGDVFEMEDQRNWSDASFKIYNRPLAWATPYVLEAGNRIMQRITVTLRQRQEVS